MVGLDIHSEPGILKVNQKLTKNSGTTVTEFCKNRIAASDGNSYWFSADSGKIWKRTSTDVWSLVHTNTQCACLGAREFEGYIYYASAAKLGRISVSAAASEASWASQNDSWQSFSAGDTGFHPMEEVNAKLLIGDGKYIASLDNVGTFISQALTIPAVFRVSALYPYGINILFGTYVGSSSAIKVNYCMIGTWDTYGDSYTGDVVFEAGINAFIPADNEVFVQAGMFGNIYYYNGSTLVPFRTIQGTYTPVRYNIVYNQAVGFYKGLPMFGLSNSPDTANSTGNPANCGVYSLGSHNKNYPSVPNLEYPVSATSPLASVEIGCIAVIGNLMYVAWKKQGGSPTYGVDCIDVANKYASAYIESLVISDEVGSKKAVNLYCGYRLLPTNTAISISIKKNFNSSWGTPLTDLETNTDQNLISKKENLIDCRAIQQRIDFTVAGNDGPEVDLYGMDFE
jgi:hypothetical protein